MARPIRNHLTDMDIDEISTVDKAANQYSRFVIAKRAPEEEEMPQFYNQEGQPLDDDYELEIGEVVYDEEGDAYEFVVEDDDTVVEEPEPELAEVGKAGGYLAGGAKAFKEGFKFPGGGKHMAPDVASVMGTKTRPSHRLGQFAGRNKKKLAGGAAAAGAAGAGGAYAMKKSFSDEVMEELSKAFSDDDRDQIIAKALGRVEELETAQKEAIEIAKSERDLRLTREYISKAAEYNLPVAPEELGPVLYRMAETMSYEDCSVIAKCLETAGTILFEEAGYTGGGDNADIYSQVSARAHEAFGKAEDFNEVTAINKVFDQNPDAYDEYLAAQRNR